MTENIGLDDSLTKGFLTCCIFLSAKIMFLTFTSVKIDHRINKIRARLINKVIEVIEK